MGNAIIDGFSRPGDGGGHTGELLSPVVCSTCQFRITVLYGYRIQFIAISAILAALREQAGMEDYNTAIKRYVHLSMGKISRPEDFGMAFSDAPGYPFSALRLMYFQNQT